MICNTPLPLKLRMVSEMHSNLTIYFLGADRSNFTLLLMIITNIGNYISNEKASCEEYFKFYGK